MRNASTRVTPTYDCSYVLVQTDKGYQIVKDTVNRSFGRTLSQEECDRVMNGPHKACIVLPDKTRIYNFAINPRT